MKQIRVLVVDDQPLVREGLASIISSQSDLKVVGQAQDGLEAVAMARQEKPDVILLDLVMPKQDGLSSISKLRDVAPSSKILILTGYADNAKVYQAIMSGAIGYMLKDFTYEQLLQAVRDVANGLSYIDSSIAMKMIQNINPIGGQSQIHHATTLTERELQVLRLIAKGHSNQDIADELVVDKRTVAKYVSSILNKLQLANRTQAALYAVREGLDK